MPFPILSFLIFLPAVGAVLVALLPREREEEIRWVSLLVTALELALSLPLWFAFESHIQGMQFVEARAWIPSAGIGYRLGVDGISMPLVLLTSFLGPLTVLCSWTAVTRRVKGFFVNLLMLQAGVVGVFCALDLVLFYVFWEAMLIPMYLLIGVWGGERRIYAAVKFILFTMAGSLLMFLAILYLYAKSPDRTFDLATLQETLRLPFGAQMLAFLAFGIAFAIKVPLFPFHTWLPDAHVEAPTAGSVVLAGVLLKMGVYGFLRFAYPLFPLAVHAAGPYIAALGVVGIVYGALMALAQEDMKKLVAYSSVSHLGAVVVGLFSAGSVRGIEGCVFQMVSHGLSTGALFLLVGMLYERTHTRRIADYGGLAKALPAFSFAFMIATLSSIGLPGLNGFVGEFLILLGAFETWPVVGVLASTGVVLGAVYMLLLAQKILFGPPAGVVVRQEGQAPHGEPILAAAHADGGSHGGAGASFESALPDLNARERGILIAISVPMFVLGLFPGLLLEPMQGTVELLLRTYWRAIAG